MVVHLFYLSVAKEVLDKAKEHANTIADHRVIGVLLGKMENDVLIIHDAIPTEFRKKDQGVQIPAESIAKVADLIAEQKVEGNVVGWYHSHPGYGAFMSDVDIKTQLKLQQFSPYIVSMVFDPSTDDVKFFTLEDKEGKITEIKGENLYLFEKNQNPIPKAFKKPPVKKETNQYSTPTSQPEARPTPSLNRRQISVIVTVIVLISVILGSFLIWISLQGGGVVATTSLPVIEHVPVRNGVVGKEITLKARVTEGSQGIKNVTIEYEYSTLTTTSAGLSIVDREWKAAFMLLAAAGGDEYAYTIPAEEVSGHIDYYIRAVDKQDHTVATSIYTIKIGDYELESSTEKMKVFLGETQSATITIMSIGDFQSPVKLSLSDTPYGIQAKLDPDVVTPPKSGEAAVTLTISASPSTGTFRGQFELKIYGKADKAEHQETISVLIPSYDVIVSLSSLTITRGESGTATVKVSPVGEFDREIEFSITGLPSEAEWDLSLKDNKIVVAQDTELVLKIDTTTKVQTGTYILTFVSEGGGIKYQSTITMTIK
ncbi:Mov34/MPN/PAD-1 family protein [[Eubacterium] cellulosolvens]